MFESSIGFSSRLEIVYGSYGSAVHKAVVEYDALDKNTYQCIPLAEHLEQQLLP